MKDKIRLRQKNKRGSFTGAEREAADDAVLFAFMSSFGNFDSYFIYNSIRSEADTSRIISALLKSDKSVFLPRVEGKGMNAVPVGETRKGAFGINEPVGQAYGGVIDAAVIPLLAVNGRGYRIGYGGGYYDKFLKERTIFKIGLGYSFQEEEFAEDEWDMPLDVFVCEKGVRYFGR